MRGTYEEYHNKRNIQKEVINKNNFTYRNILPVIEKYGVGRKYLDIGCGVGSIDFYLAARNKTVLGIDASQNAIDVAKANARFLGLGNNIKFLVKDFPSEIPRAKYKNIVCLEVLEHLESDKKALFVIREILQKDGILILSVPSQNAPLYKLGVVKNFDKKVGHLRRYNLEKLERLLRETGFRVIFKKKSEGVFRNSLFVFGLCDIFLKIANRVPFISMFFSKFDEIFLSVFGESQLILVATKK